ncbi:hypothetical protein EIP86_009385 [Pleurotus ostreatoroseus]|nr:hypothetical protein EIP86_009385 [Pleurotus ostreatoroseus]
MPIDPEDIEEEQKHFATLAVNNRRRKDVYTIPRHDQELLGRLGYKNKISEVDKAIEVNADFLKKIIAEPEIFQYDEEDTEVSSDNAAEIEADSAMSHSHTPELGSPVGQRSRPSEADIEKLRSTIKQFVRDWSEEGKAERDLCYEPMKEALLKHFESVPANERY